jgi:hypothetical protein
MDAEFQTPISRPASSANSSHEWPYSPIGDKTVPKNSSNRNRLPPNVPITNGSNTSSSVSQTAPILGGILNPPKEDKIAVAGPCITNPAALIVEIHALMST